MALSRPPGAGHPRLGYPHGCKEELATLVEHALLDDLIGPQQKRLWDCEAERLGGLEVDH